jgi:hypothetical protein
MEEVSTISQPPSIVRITPSCSTTQPTKATVWLRFSARLEVSGSSLFPTGLLRITTPEKLAGCLSRSLRKSGSDAAGDNTFAASVENPAYDNHMAKARKFDLENPAPILDDEDEETLAAIDEGIRDAEAGLVLPAEKARELLPKWTTDSSTRR